MMKLRKWSSLGKAEKLGRKNAFIVSIVFAIMIFIVFCFFFISIATIPNVGLIVAFNTFFKGSSKIIILIIQFGPPICFYFLIKNKAIDSAYDKCIQDYSKKLAKEILVRGKPTKIKLIRARDNMYKRFLLADLPKHGVTYYAMLEVKTDTIALYAKFPNEDEENFFEDIRKEETLPLDWIELEEFSSFCEIVDD